MHWYISIVVYVLVAVSIVRVLISMKNRTIPLLSGLFWIAAWLMIGIIFWNPEIASRVAVLIGIGRGADVVVYSSIILIMYLLYRIFVRLEKIDRDITLLNRDNALLHAERKNTRSDSDRQL